jgi:hypothetical protein
MVRKSHVIRLSAVLAVSLGSSLVAPTHAQETSPGLSSGSGQGTGTGLSTGVQRNRSGSISGVGPSELDAFGRPLPPYLPETGRVQPPFGPDFEERFPKDSELLRFTRGGLPAAGVTQELVKNARLITDPGERSLALQKIADGAIKNNQLILAHQTLEEAISATAQVTVPLVRDQRLIAIVDTLHRLTYTLLIEDGKKLLFQPPMSRGDQIPIEDDTKKKEGDAVAKQSVPSLDALPESMDVLGVIRLAQLEWKRGAYLSSLISNPTYRNEKLHDIAKSAASGSQKIATELANPVRPQQPDEFDKLPKPEQQEWTEALTRYDQMLNRVIPEFKRLADEILVGAFEDAKKIDRLIWKYHAMYQITIEAADSRQFSRGVQLAKQIDNAESRAEAMILLAEAECRNDQNEDATVPYQEAARAVASIQQEGLRGVLARFLVESLITSGRFDDARFCTSLEPNSGERFMLLGAVAEAQGRRGSAESARRWIASAETPAEYRSALYRRVTAGVLYAIEQNRGREESGQLTIPTARPTR